jgi:PAS domain S-box-containing protein
MHEKPSGEIVEQKVKSTETQFQKFRGLGLRSIFSGLESSFPIGITDLAGNIIYVNEPLVKMWGYSNKEEIIGGCLPKFWDGDRIFKTIEDLESKGFSTGEDRGKRKDGSVFDVYYVAILCKSNDGIPEYMLGQFFDITKRKQAMQELSETKEKYQALFDQLPDPIAVIDLETNQFFEHNKKLCQFLGYSPDEIPNLKPTDIEASETKEEIYKLSEKIIREGSDSFETKLRTKHGDIRDVLVSARHIHLGTRSLIQGVFTDITDRKKTENKLRLSEERYRSLFEGADVLVSVYDRNGICQLMNRKAAALFGGVPDDFVNKSFDELHPGMGKEYTRRVRQVIDSGLSEDYEDEVRFPQGKRWLLSKVHPVKNAQGVIVSAQIVSQDITERKQAEDVIRESRQKYQYMVDNIGIGVALISPDMEVLELNKQMRKWFPTIDPGHGTICYRVFKDPPGDGICEYCPADKTFQDGNVHESTTATPFSGSIRNIRIVSSPIMNANGEVTATIEMVEDITDRLNLENRLKQSQKLESIGTLAGGIAHDFNNILSAIIGFTELAMVEVEKNSMIEDNLLEVYSAGKRAKDLVRQILAFARQSEEKVKPVRVDHIIDEVLQFIRSSIPTTIEIKKKIDSHSLILGNKTQLHQIMMNLCTNAAHSMEDGGGILEVSLKDIDVDSSINKRLDLKTGQYIEINVIDTGTGISPHIIDSIFEPYFTTKEPGEGTGMGLAMVHGIVESYGGKIAVKSKLGKGTAFTVFLPTTRKRKIHHQYEPGQLPTGAERILFVDDEAPIAIMSSQILERLGYAVTTRTSSAEAYELFKSKPNDFDMVITDMTMPNMTGDKLATELMRIRSDIPIILCTGYSKKISEDNALQIGIRAFAYKPIVMADLAKTIRKVFDETK